MHDIVTLIKKLLRLARDKAASPAEASQALNRAMELIQRHNVDAAALDLDTEEESFVTEKIEIGWRTSLAKHHALLMVDNYFGVRVVLSRPHAAIMGRESDVAIARYVWSFLLGAINRATTAWATAEKKARRKTTGQKRQAFQQGWFYGLRASLSKPAAELPDTRTGIVLATRAAQLKAYADQQFPHTAEVPKRKSPRQNKAAIYQGYIAGRSTTIHKPLARSTNETFLLE
jgi:hypothetical protein